MVNATCIQKFRDKRNVIVGYRIQDDSGNVKDVTPQQLKQAISNRKIEIRNLKLTSDGKLIRCDSKFSKGAFDSDLYLIHQISTHVLKYLHIEKTLNDPEKLE